MAATKELKDAYLRKEKVTHNKLVYGVGVMDLPGKAAIKISGKWRDAPAYGAWSSMLERAYCPKYQAQHPAYLGVTVCEEWLAFSNFKRWYDANHVEGWQLDKDLLIPGNRQYNPGGCIYIPQALNSFLNSSGRTRGKYPIGVHWDAEDKKFRATIRVNGKSKSLGRFATAMEAHLCWWSKKFELASEYKDLCDSIDKRLFSGLLANVWSMREDLHCK